MVDYYDARWKIKVVQELKRWTEDVLSQPSDFFNGLPPCPYALSAWANNKVRVDFGDADRVAYHCLNWDDQLDLLIVIAEKSWDWDLIEPWCARQNKVMAEHDIALMSFIPDDNVGTGQPEEEMVDWEPIIEEDYAMIFIQRLSEVNAASESLERSGYYKNCTAEFLGYVKDRREREANARQEQEEGDEEVQWIS
tara:strand:+ start:590 stop:1174 length:585 start_codon:yes stop_codon:yes gene_type:complete